MPWTSLGAVDLTRTWQLFPQQSFNSETFRISQPNIGAVDGYFLLQPYYILSQAVGSTRRVYASDDVRILAIPQPPEFLERDLGVRSFGVKLSARARIFAGAAWRVELEEFY